MTKKKLISICIPVLNEEANIQLAYDKLINVLAGLTEYDFEFMFTDNASQDTTYQKIEKLAKQDKRVRLVRFSKNHGYQKSILTGYFLANGDAVIQLDCDMQDPPELIPEFLSKWSEGYEVVYGIRVARQEGLFITLCRKAFYRLMNAASENHLPLDAGDFRLLDKKLVNVLAEIDDQSPYIRGMLSSIGFNQIGIEYRRDSRKFGESKFGFKQLFSLAIDGLVSNSFLPLRIISYSGICLALISLICILIVILARLIIGNDWPLGFTTLALIGLANITVVTCLFGVFGTYLSRLIIQSKPMPLAIIEKGIRVGQVPKNSRVRIINASEDAKS